jgi:Holliday junction resolvasome, endonuclease subunit
MVILGIDPGFGVTGFGVLKKNGNAIYLMDFGYLRMPATKSLAERTGIFHAFFEKKIKEWEITDLALETPFLGKNAQNFLKLGYLRGILYLLSHQHSLTLHEFSPREVKQAVTGYGAASKDQVARVILQLFPKIKAPDKLDVTDALAVTLCGLWRDKRLVPR